MLPLGISKTTIDPREQHSKIGMPVGEHGCASLSSPSPESDAQIPSLKLSLLLPTIERGGSEDALNAPPATEAWIAARLRVCQSLFFTPDQTEGVTKLVVQRWIDLVGHLPGPVLAAAFDEWEATKTHRPSPAHIKQIADDKIGRAVAVAAVEEEPFVPVRELTDDEIERRQAIAREFGFGGAFSQRGVPK